MERVLDVLIVGAGPTGLMMALQLARRGVSLRIIDRNRGPALETRAVGVQARTLEFFQQLGFGDRAVAEGRRIERLHVVQGGRVRARFEVGRVGLGQSRYPYMLALGQDQTEALLLEQLQALGINVERATEARAIDDQGDRLRIQLRPAGAVGPQATAGDLWVQARWVCGCDGAGSMVRHALGVPFEGGTYEHTFYLADCRVDGPLADDGITICPERRTLTGFFAMKGERHFRVIGKLPPGLSRETKLPFTMISDLAVRGSAMPITLSAPRWTSIYRLHHRCASSMRASREGRVFLLGDAAHVHSPVGGQGMNTGLQDATNLAWRLALVIQGHASGELLAGYEEERMPNARRLLKTTDRFFILATHENPIVAALRGLLLGRLLGFMLGRRRFRRFAFRVVSQIGITYRKESLAANARTAGAAPAPVSPGSRLPFVTIAGEDGRDRDLADLCHGRWFTAIALGADDGTRSLAQILDSTPALAPFVALRSVSFRAANASALAAFGVTKGAPRVVIVRPDLHLFGAWPMASARDALTALAQALRIDERLPTA